ncbi:hypothetical protein [Acinetobacter soli]|uniref:hypothetical protein n=1 Tax=Acinetobacter soli TaxID=487316 RepID=UPI00148F2C86|nr:hypothetical protein [Acinetobacter soli]
MTRTYRKKLLDQANVKYYQSIDLVRAPYPTWYGYTGVFSQQSVTFPFYIC